MRMLRKLLLVLGIASCFSGTAAETKVAIQKPDVRLLIDISGSMKKNDPNNLRVPALQLVTNLMPKGADAGVWAFGRYVNMMVPLAQVDQSWQQKATQSAKKINSAGLFTNIGGALEKSIYGWKSTNIDEKRSVILLTDGMVDISKNAQVNAKERQRILSKVLPRLVQAKVKIHTIALSQNADHELLKALSNQTDGWYQAVDSAEELQKIFLKIFEQAAARDSLPMTDNQFKVDASIDEMTLLVFKQNENDKTRLVTPDNKEIKEASADGSVRWFSTDGYDLITIQSPTVGNWKIDANVDPDNRVMVVSKLGLNVAEVPNNLLAGEAINYQVSLLEDGKTITKSDFLQLVEARLEQEKQGQSSRLAMFFDGSSHQFKQNFFTDMNEGVLNLTLEVKSPTFERTRNHAVNVYGSPLTHQLELSNDESIPHSLLFTVREDIVKANSLKANLTITYPDGEKQYLVLDDFSKAVEIKVIPQGGEYSVALSVKGQSILDREFSVSPSPIAFSGLPTEKYLASQKTDKKTEPEINSGAEEPVKQETAVEEAKEADKGEDAEPEATTTEENNEETEWKVWLYIGLAANLLLGLLGFLGWKLIKKKSHQNSALVASELVIDDETDD